MFQRASVRVVAGMLYGGTAGLLLSGLYYSRTWASDAAIDERHQLSLLLTHLMGGLAYGVLVGVLFGIPERRKLGAWVGLIAFGVLGVYVGELASLHVGAAYGWHPRTVGIAIASALPPLGALIGRWLVK